MKADITFCPVTDFEIALFAPRRCNEPLVTQFRYEEYSLFGFRFETTNGHILVGLICLFASVVGPYAGFLASGLKRAYGIKDFAATLPGHGGLIDRFDCTFIMAVFCALMLNSGLFMKDQIDLWEAQYLVSGLSQNQREKMIRFLLN